MFWYLFWRLWQVCWKKICKTVSNASAQYSEKQLIIFHFIWVCSPLFELITLRRIDIDYCIKSINRLTGFEPSHSSLCWCPIYDITWFDLWYVISWCVVLSNVISIINCYDYRYYSFIPIDIEITLGSTTHHETTNHVSNHAIS